MRASSAAGAATRESMDGAYRRWPSERRWGKFPALDRLRLLLLTRDFPPHKSGGVRRVGALAEHLPAHGVDVTVVASEGDPDRRYPPIAVPVRRASGKLHCGWLYRRAVRWAAIPDENVLDLPSAIAAGAFAARPDLILASAPPHSLFVAADVLARRFGCPWVADYRDPWTEHPRFAPPTPLHRLGHQALEAYAIGRARALLAATDSMARDLERRAPAGTLVHAFLNGFDPGTFEARPERPARDRIVVGYYGSFYGAIDPEPIVQAVLQAGARLEHAGADFDGALAAAAKKHGADVVSLGVLTPPEAAARMQQADVLVMTLPDDPAWAYCRTQKLPEYLASGRPILALVPEGEAADLIARLGAGIAVRPGRTDEAARAIRALAARADPRPMPLDLSWDRQVGEVANVLRAAAATRA